MSLRPSKLLLGVSLALLCFLLFGLHSPSLRLQLLQSAADFVYWKSLKCQRWVQGRLLTRSESPASHALYVRLAVELPGPGAISYLQDCASFNLTRDEAELLCRSRGSPKRSLGGSPERWPSLLDAGDAEAWCAVELRLADAQDGYHLRHLQQLLGEGGATLTDRALRSILNLEFCYFETPAALETLLSELLSSPGIDDDSVIPRVRALAARFPAEFQKALRSVLSTPTLHLIPDRLRWLQAETPIAQVRLWPDRDGS